MSEEQKDRVEQEAEVEGHSWARTGPSKPSVTDTNKASRSDDDEVEAHRQISPRQSSPRGDEFEGEGRQSSPLADDDDEVEAHKWGQHSPDMRS
jgi:hypothetical protein